MNEASSRSHAILTLAVTLPRPGGGAGVAPATTTLTSVITVVDLAGSERVSALPFC